MTYGTKLALIAALAGLAAPALANHHEKKDGMAAGHAMMNKDGTPMTAAQKKEHDAMVKQHDAMMKNDAMQKDKPDNMAAPKQ